MDVITPERIKENLKYDFFIKYFDEVDSTNIIIKKEAKNGACEGLVVIADRQTAGHGRFSRKFHSPKNCGIYMTILLRPDLAPENAVLITSAAAVAVSEAIEKLNGKKTGIKWVNDILIDGKKVCGILTEGAIDIKSGKFDFAAVGIGINAYKPENDFENDIKDLACAVFEKKSENMRNRLIAEVLNNFWDYYKTLSSKSFLKGYRERLCYLGEEVNILKNGEIVDRAKCLGIDDDCRLLVEFENGEKEYLSSGEISIRKNG